MRTGNRTRALEEERHAILFRIQESRDEYRKLLGGGDATKGRLKRNPRAQHRIVDGEVIDVAGKELQPASSTRFAAMHPALHWVRTHPWICMGIVATIAAIGPRQIFRAGMRSTTMLAGTVPALTRRNSKNADADRRLLVSGLATSVVTSLASSLAAYLQQRRPR